MNSQLQNKPTDVKMFGSSNDSKPSGTGMGKPKDIPIKDSAKESSSKDADPPASKEEDYFVDALTDLPSASTTTFFEETLLFRCPELGEEVLTQKDWKQKFAERLDSLRQSDEILAAILTIKSMNPQREAEQCVAVLEKYIKNIIENPNNDKYESIRLGNQILYNTVLKVEGGADFLKSIGFRTVLGGKGLKEPYLVFSPKQPVDLTAILNSLETVSGFELEPERSLKIIPPGTVTNDDEVTDDFFEWTPSEIQKEQKRREVLSRQREILRFKSRHQDTPSYSYTRIRVKFPDGFMVEAVFTVKEKLRSLKSLLLSKFYFYDNFSFIAFPFRVFNVLDEEKTFGDLKLYSNVTLMLKWENNLSGMKYTLKE